MLMIQNTFMKSNPSDQAAKSSMNVSYHGGSLVLLVIKTKIVRDLFKRVSRSDYRCIAGIECISITNQASNQMYVLAKLLYLFLVCFQGNF